MENILGDIYHEGVTIRVNEVFGEENITAGPDVTWWLYKTEEHDT